MFPLWIPLGGETSETPPVAEKVSLFRGSAPIGGRVSARESAGATVFSWRRKPTDEGSGGCKHDTLRFSMAFFLRKVREIRRFAIKS